MPLLLIFKSSEKNALYLGCDVLDHGGLLLDFFWLVLFLPVGRHLELGHRDISFNLFQQRSTLPSPGRWGLLVKYWSLWQISQTFSTSNTNKLNIPDLRHFYFLNTICINLDQIQWSVQVNSLQSRSDLTFDLIWCNHQSCNRRALSIYVVLPITLMANLVMLIYITIIISLRHTFHLRETMAMTV